MNKSMVSNLKTPRWWIFLYVLHSSSPAVLPCCPGTESPAYCVNWASSGGGGAVQGRYTCKQPPLLLTYQVG